MESDPGVHGLIPSGDPGRTIGTVVVGDDIFPVVIGLRQNALDAGLKISFTVEYRSQYGNQRLSGIHQGSSL
jgi:hypothetical protein